MNMADANKLLPGAGKACDDCGEVLRSSIGREKNRFKSCPNCSGAAGDHHVFRHPEEFGTTDERITENHPDGIHSWCQKCRALNRPHPTGRVNDAKGVRCRDVRAAAIALIRAKPPAVRRKK